ncbi:MAG: hypothetical protein JF887_05485 [Candidatus Dormibacteraeota bacterium]|uniref:Uncharacterized protein n=1 Tax=Candidatus Amunia macphersoniae TaxID=3127014 RepID=A0A934KPJ5_9BACT|nr:hypothetical protein [Candidatus Dormibacteraeota bacterium]
MITGLPRKAADAAEHMTVVAVVPTPRRTRHVLIAVWLAAVLVFGGLTAYSRAVSAPLADPDPAYQRPGFLDVIPAYAAPPLGVNLPVPHARSVVFFTRPQLEQDLLSSVGADASLQSAARMVVVVCGPGAAATSAGSIAVVAQDVTCPAAGLYKMRSPRDGGAPVGYAIVSSSGMVRYSTLDPEVTRLLDEVELMTRGVS